ncbi:PrpF domain-containing protein [Halobacillus sp. ACCC02827]|uniref:2-methylaconitate cis-trans isomerase PrpF family protein n=1 Tax=Halobacillus sp. ACCC02827 TaxID=3052090 RepID=UPI00257032CA|nr:PrpF domain-containing protein [Halobacillus sp. ACCC02827]WJE17245.1 PrpF domain-containing protein [Halobacillus sp. ACCC02827]
MYKVPVTLMRGGTSKGVFILKDHMPADREEWEPFLLDIMGSPDPNQIDGLGGANSLTSKVAIISKSTHPFHHVDYTFAQVSLDKQVVDFNGNCGNISSAVGPYAISKGMVDVLEPVTTVQIWNTNTKKLISAEVEVEGGKVKTEGSYEIPGVPGSGSPIFLSFEKPEGAVTGRIFPSGKPKEYVACSYGTIPISIVDVANPLVMVNAAHVGLAGDELPDDFSSETLKRLEEVRSIAAELCGFSAKEDASDQSPAVPKLTIVAETSKHTDIQGITHEKEDVDVLVRMMSMQKPHKALAITGAVCLSVASRLTGTVLSDLAIRSQDSLRIGHPGGVLEAYITEDPDVRVKIGRTARLLMEGIVYTKKDYEIKAKADSRLLSTFLHESI